MQFKIGLKNQTAEQLVDLQMEFELLKAEYDIEHNVNTYMIMYEITFLDAVLEATASKKP